MLLPLFLPLQRPTAVALRLHVDIPRKADRRSAGCIQLVYMMDLVDVRVVFRSCVHQPGQHAVHTKEEVHANAEVAGPEQAAFVAFYKRAYIGHVIVPASGAHHYGHTAIKAQAHIGYGLVRLAEFNGHIATRGIGARVLRTHTQSNFMSTCLCDLLNGLAHFAVSVKGYAHGANGAEGIRKPRSPKPKKCEQMEVSRFRRDVNLEFVCAQRI